MKKKTAMFCTICFAAVLFCNSLLSCSNGSQGAGVLDESTTLRSTAESLYTSTLWTEELEVDRLTAKVNAVSGISEKLNLTPLVVSARVSSDAEKIFPSLENFGSLDTTLISSPLRDMLSSFCEAVSTYEDADRFMLKESLYTLSLFYSDFERIFSTCFDFSEPQASEQTPEAGESSDEAPVTEKKRFFDSFVLGQPFLDGRYYEVPVKFFSKEATMTLSVYCFEESGSWKIDQIQIADWEIFDGK